MRCYALLLFLQGSLAFEFPFQVPFFKSKGSPNIDDTPTTTTPRIAIIGAGAGGSSAAFWISKAKSRFGLDVEIDVYEQSSYVGGRSTVVYPYDDHTLPELELGASIFVEANKNLWRASEAFNLTRRDFSEENYETGIWDGDKFLLEFHGDWWDTLKVLWRYGINAPRRTEAFVQAMVNKFLTLYARDTPRWDNISDVASFLGWNDLVASTTSEYLLAQGVSSKYINEIVEAATRVNYGQDVDSIHALEGACSMAAIGATAIKGGNFQIFEQFLKRSGANVYLNTAATSITQNSASSHQWTIKSSRGSVNYKAVILAAPFHSTGIIVPSTISEQIPPQPYVHLHVTLLTTTSSSPNASYFGLPVGSAVPQVVLTTKEGARQGGHEPEFNSISYHGLVREGEWAVKIFSKEEVTKEWLNEVFSGNVGWVHRKEWDAYPKLPPTTSFPPVKLDQGFYYVNAFETFISTMETETISSRNVADLLLNEEFGASICGPRISGSMNETIYNDDLLGEIFSITGWDC